MHHLRLLGRSANRHEDQEHLVLLNVDELNLNLELPGYLGLRFELLGAGGLCLELLVGLVRFLVSALRSTQHPVLKDLRLGKEKVCEHLMCVDLFIP